MNAYIQRVYSDLPAHNMIRYTMNFWALGAWGDSGANDNFVISFNGNEVPGWALHHVTFPGDLCGSGVKDLKDLKIYGRIAHSAANLDFKVISKLTVAHDRLFGFRDVTFMFDNGGIESDYKCGNAPIALGNSECGCEEGKFHNGVSCQDCHVNCASCFGEGENQCFVCKNPGTFDGIKCNQMCNGISVQYIQSTSLGHRYKLTTLPTNCYMDVNTQTIALSPSFIYSITPINQKESFIDLILTDSILEETKLNITLNNTFSTTTFVPLSFTSSKAIEDFKDAIPAIQAVLMGIFGASVIGMLALGAGAALWSIISAQQFIGYFLYMNIQYPPHLEVLLLLLDTSFWSFLPNPIMLVTESFSESVFKSGAAFDYEFFPPKKFAKYAISAFFVENGGSILFLNVMSLILLWIVEFLKRFSQFKTNLILKNLKVILKWNFIARLFLENGMALCIAIFLQFTAMSFETTFFSICSILALFALFYFLAMFVFLFRILKKRDNDLLSMKLIGRIYGTLYEGIILNTSTAKYYYMMVFIRGMILGLVLVFMEDSPLLQILPLVFFNVGLIYYLFKYVKFKRKALNYIIRIKEIFILTGEIGIMFLNAKVKSYDYYSAFGWLTIVFLGSAIGMEGSYLVYLQITGIRQIYRNITNKLKNVYRYLAKSSEKNVRPFENNTTSKRAHTTFEDSNNSMFNNSVVK